MSEQPRYRVGTIERRSSLDGRTSLWDVQFMRVGGGETPAEVRVTLSSGAFARLDFNRTFIYEEVERLRMESEQGKKS